MIDAWQPLAPCAPPLTVARPHSTPLPLPARPQAGQTRFPASSYMGVLAARYTSSVRHSPQAAQSQLQACMGMKATLLDTFACYACLASQDQLLLRQLGQGSGEWGAVVLLGEEPAGPGER